MYELFIHRRFTKSSERIIEQADAIIAEYQEQGFSLTLRQLYYQFVARDLLANEQKEYKRLGSIINDARLAGLIDWAAIEDRTRFLRDYLTYDNPREAGLSAARNYLEDLWDGQPHYVEVWIEKDALVGVIEPVCGRWRLPYFACRGYSSQSEQYSAGKRLLGHLECGQEPIILHLGDHDPSGIDMTRDNQERLTMFAGLADGIDVRRIALNMDQIRRYRPPPNPAKETDSRISGYYERFNTSSSWELDALDPRVIDQLIDTEIRDIVDDAIWQRAVEREQRNKDRLLSVVGML